MDKKEVKPDRFEKWRILAEESQGQTPDSKQYDLDLETSEKEKVENINQAAVELKDKKSEAPIKNLPDMAVTMKMHDVSVAVLLRTLARAADMNIMINETVTGDAKININNIPWSQAFTGILNTYGLTYKWSGDVL
ncbi:MAG: type IV pilus secretin PilQ, partial [Proteobacteria bacterium]|nr:type IV pilus secretin PilQ [Pseudomonadota bacterium]